MKFWNFGILEFHGILEFWNRIGLQKKGVFDPVRGLEWGALLPLRGVPPAEGFSEPGKKGFVCGGARMGGFV